MPLTLRATKGAPLTIAEFDGNFTYLDGRITTLEGATPDAPTVNSTVSGTTWTLTFNGTPFVHSIPTVVQTPPTVVSDNGTTITLSVASRNTYTRTTSAAAVTVSVPTYATSPIATGSEFHFRQSAAGSITVSAASGVTVNKRADRNAATDTQGAVFTLKKIGTNEWDLFGDLAAS